ncbi:ATP-binding protein [Streptomyces bauhiniae]
MSNTHRLSERYPRSRASVAKARSFAASFADDTGLKEQSDDLILIVSELVTNAVLHGKTGSGRQVAVTVDYNETRVRVEVRDAGEGTPRKRAAARLLAVSGRGLEIVDTLSSSWGVIEHVVGKTVWAELAIKTSEAI